MNRKEKMAEEKPLTPRCLVIVFKEKRNSKLEAGSGAERNRGASGKELFEEFTRENKNCYWNPHLEESVKSLRYVGCLHSCTLLVGGRDIYLDTVKGAWARKVLRAPAPFTIQKVGDVPGIDMYVVSQTQFTPLPEALCLIISEVTAANLVASFDLIMENLSLTYKGMQQPSEQIVYETLGSLLKEMKIFHTGNGYAIVTPETYRTNMNLTVNEHHLVIGGESPHVRTEHGVPALYIPLLSSTNKNDMCSIACQTAAKDLGDTTLDSVEEEKGKKLERSRSMRESKKGKKEKDGGLLRSASVKYSDEKAKAVVKDINLKTSDINQDKDKGEKKSVLSKIFGKSKKKKIPATIEETEDKPELEYATFSAQFPPPEWAWESQVQQAVDTHKQAVSKSRTWHHLQSPPRLDAGKSDSGEDTDIFDYHRRSCPVRKSRTLPEGQTGFPADLSPTHLPPHGARSMSSDSMEVPLPPQPATSTPQSPRKRDPLPESSRKQGHRRRSRPEKGKDVRPKSGYRAPDDSPEQQQQPEEEGLERPSHVARVFRKYKEMKHSSSNNNDISVEYCGKLPRKGSTFGMSRDSGVNCVGLNGHKSVNGKEDNNCTTNKNTSDVPLNNVNETNNSGSSKQLNTPNIQDNLHQANYSGISPFTTQAQIHAVQEQCQEDSGFNSPRTLDLSEPGPVLPRPVQFLSPHEERCRQPDFSTPDKQADSVPITGSDFYPTYANSYVPESNGYAPESNGYLPDGNGLEESSHMWSDSSKQTVHEVENYVTNSRSASMPPTLHRRIGELSPTRHHSVHRDVNGYVSANKTVKDQKLKKGYYTRDMSPLRCRENLVNDLTAPENNNNKSAVKPSNNHCR